MNEIMPILCVCEGQSDEAFLDALIVERRLNGLGIWRLNYDEKSPDQAGVSGFGKRLKGMLAATGIEVCKLIVIVADNDNEPTKRFSDVQEEIRCAGYFGIPSLPRTATKPCALPPNRHVPDILVLMLPWDDMIGALETMCFAAGTAERPALAKCILKFIRCAKADKVPISKLSKLQVRCMLGVLCPDNPDISFKWSWKSGKVSVCPWPVSHREFATITKYFRALLKEYQS